MNAYGNKKIDYEKGNVYYDDDNSENSAFDQKM